MHTFIFVIQLLHVTRAKLFAHFMKMNRMYIRRRDLHIFSREKYIQKFPISFCIHVVQPVVAGIFLNSCLQLKLSPNSRQYNSLQADGAIYFDDLTTTLLSILYSAFLAQSNYTFRNQMQILTKFISSSIHIMNTCGLKSLIQSNFYQKNLSNI